MAPGSIVFIALWSSRTGWVALVHEDEEVSLGEKLGERPLSTPLYSRIPPPLAFLPFPKFVDQEQASQGVVALSVAMWSRTVFRCGRFLP